MKTLLNIICSVTSFSMLSAVIITLIPNASKLKKSLAVLSGLICILMLLPIFKIDVKEFSIDVSQSQQAVDIDSLLNDRITAAIKAEITEISTPILKKYEVYSAKVTLDAEILDESGIFIRSINYIVTEGLSSKSALEQELQSATGYNCKVICGEEQ